MKTLHIYISLYVVYCTVLYVLAMEETEPFSKSN